MILDLEWALNPMTRVFLREWRRRFGHRPNEKCENVKMQAETGDTLPQTKELRAPPELEEAKKESSLEPSEGTGPCQHLDF